MLTPTAAPRHGKKADRCRLANGAMGWENGVGGPPASLEFRMTTSSKAPVIYDISAIDQLEDDHGFSLQGHTLNAQCSIYPAE